jgi:hypothetical protein
MAKYGNRPNKEVGSWLNECWKQQRENEADAWRKIRLEHQLKRCKRWIVGNSHTLDLSDIPDSLAEVRLQKHLIDLRINESRCKE